MATTKPKMEFTKSAGLRKTLAHRWLFDINSPTLNAIINIVAPTDQIELFKNMFTELNKNHVNAGIHEFAPMVGATFSWNQNKYGITNDQYTEMRNFSKPFGSRFKNNEYAIKIYENKFLLDAIHEAVILYFPKRDERTGMDIINELIQNARNDLIKSLDGYVGTRTRHITPPGIEAQPDNIDKLKTDITAIKTSFVNLPNVLHLEAVAELHRHLTMTGVVVAGGSNKKAKTQKSRILKKWKSRRCKE